MKKWMAVLFLFPAVFLVAGESGSRETGLGVSYARFVVDGEDDFLMLDGWGLEMYTLKRTRFPVGLGVSSDLYWFGKMKTMATGDFVEFEDVPDDIFSAGGTLLAGPGLELSLGPVGLQVIAGAGLDFTYYGVNGAGSSYFGCFYGGDLRLLVGFTKKFRIYGSAGITMPILSFDSDWPEGWALKTIRGTLGIQFAH